MRKTWVWAAGLGGLACLLPACNAILGIHVLSDETTDATMGDASGDATTADGIGTSGDGSGDSILEGSPAIDAPPDGDARTPDAADATTDADASADGACPSGQVECDGGCAATQTDNANCGTCGKGCNGASCAGGLCGPYIIAQSPTTGTVSKVVTDGTNVIWADSRPSTFTIASSRAARLL